MPRPNDTIEVVKVVIDRTIMSFVNQWPFYSQTSLEKLPRTVPPLTEIPIL
jgi:hypothetical protein